MLHPFTLKTQLFPFYHLFIGFSDFSMDNTSFHHKGILHICSFSPYISSLSIQDTEATLKHKKSRIFNG
jgi:hypothetical protein